MKMACTAVSSAITEPILVQPTALIMPVRKIIPVEDDVV